MAVLAYPGSIGDVKKLAHLVTYYSPKALFAVSSLGLGHATRTLVVIREYLRRGYAITVISTGNALAFLRLELADAPEIDFHEIPDYPPLERGTGWRLYWYLLVDLLRTWRLIRREHREVQSRAADYEFIFSDGRYGFYSAFTPSFILSHQVAFIPPKGLREASWLTEHINVAALRRFDCLLIPDYPCPNRNLAGHLAHSPYLHRCRHRYTGILSSYRHLDVLEDIDYLFLISGYLVEHRDAFVRTLIEQASSLPGRKVFVLGSTSGESADYDAYRREDLEIHAVASGELRQAFFNRARCIISRAGYSTVMDLAEHGKRALLIPTPNQTEQEYLAYYVASQGYFVTQTQEPAIDIAEALEACSQTQLFEPPWRTEESTQRVVEEIEQKLHRHFFSIIVPAHNEEKELAATLRCLLDQRYPLDRVEIIVVENASTDRTLGIARKIAAEPSARSRVRVLQSARGVSRAKNAGLASVSYESEWVVLCDADTHLGRNFLHHLNTWLNRHSEGTSIGTTAVRPQPGKDPYTRGWFAAYDFIHRLTKSSFAIQIARTPVARGVRFREDLNFSEDLAFIRECRRYGRFFYLPTDQVSTSTRRFEANGYLRQGLQWLIEALSPLRVRTNQEYDVIR